MAWVSLKKDKKSEKSNRKNNEKESKNNDNMSREKQKSVYILGDSIIKKVNDYFLTKNLCHKYIVKVRSFPGAKISCMVDHVKPTIREDAPDNIILHAGTNDLRSEKTSSQIAKAIIELAMLLKTDENSVIVSSIVHVLITLIIRQTKLTTVWSICVEKETFRLFLIPKVSIQVNILTKVSFI